MRGTYKRMDILLVLTRGLRDAISIMINNFLSGHSSGDETLGNKTLPLNCR